MNGQMYKQTVEWADWQTKGQPDRRMNVWTDGQRKTDINILMYTDRRTDEWNR